MGPFVVLLYSLKTAVDDIPAMDDSKLNVKGESELEKKQWNMESVGTDADDNAAKLQPIKTNGLLKDDNILVEPLAESRDRSPIVVASSSSSRSTTRVLSPSGSFAEVRGDVLTESSDKEQESPKEER